MHTLRRVAPSSHLWVIDERLVTYLQWMSQVFGPFLLWGYGWRYPDVSRT